MTEKDCSSRRKKEKIQNPAYTIDHKFGDEQELLNLPIISDFLNQKFRKTKRYFVFDYENDNTYVELKSRRNAKAKYPTTIVGKNKLDYAKTCGKDVFFFFQFTDGLYYWKYNDEDNIKIAKGGRCDRGKLEFKEYGYIDIELLKLAAV